MTNDSISRQSAIDKIKEISSADWDLPSIQAEHYASGFADGYKRGMEDAERPKGHWIENDSDTWVCSECGVENAYAVYRGRICDNYCPNCGADMRGEQDANND